MIGAHLVVLIPLTFFVAALLVPLVGLSRASLSRIVAVLATATSLALSTLGLVRVLAEGPIHYAVGGWPAPIGIELVLDPLSAFVSVLVTGVSLLTLIHSGHVVRTEHAEVTGPFYAATLLLLGGLTGILVTGDLFNLFVFLEISSISAYAILALGDPRSPLASFRYLILGSIGAAFYLLGLGFLLQATGSLNMADVAAILPPLLDSPLVLVGLALMTSGIALKMGLFPVHQWLPDAYSYASSAATALIAPVGTKVAAYILIRLFFYVLNSDVAGPLANVLGYLGCAGIIWGSLLAIAQTDLKRMLASSSIGQIGYIALGIGLASPAGLIGAVLHTLNHAVMKACLFLVSANFRTRLGHSEIPSLDPATRRAMPWTSAAFTVAAISMIGLPPTAGFFSKWYLVVGSVEQSNWIFVTSILASSLLNAVYFFRVIERIYIRAPEPGSGAVSAGVPVSGEVGGSMLAPTLILASAVLALGLANVWIVGHLIEPMIPPGISGTG